MEIVSVRDLARRMRELLDKVETTGEPVLVTRRGRPVGVFYSVAEGDLEDFVLAHAPEFTTAMREADEELTAGATVSLREAWGSTNAVLSSQESRILALLVNRQASEGIAEELHLGPEAVATSIRDVLSKLTGRSKEEIDELIEGGSLRPAQGPADARRGQ